MTDEDQTGAKRAAPLAENKREVLVLLQPRLVEVFWELNDGNLAKHLHFHKSLVMKCYLD